TGWLYSLRLRRAAKFSRGYHSSPPSMPDHPQKRHDRALGMDQAISRRDFLNSTLLASGALLGALTPAELLARAAAQGADWTGPGGVGDYAISNGNTLEVL